MNKQDKELNNELHYFDVGLRLLGIGADPYTTELLYRLAMLFAKKKGNCSMMDTCEIQEQTILHQESLRPKIGQAIKARKGRRISNP